MVTFILCVVVAGRVLHLVDQKFYNRSTMTIAFSRFDQCLRRTILKMLNDLYNIHSSHKSYEYDLHQRSVAHQRYIYQRIVYTHILKLIYLKYSPKIGDKGQMARKIPCKKLRKRNITFSKN